MHAAQNLLADLSAETPGELMQTLLSAQALRIERIVSHGQASPVGFWYDQPEHEWVLLVRGAARLRFDDEDPIELTAGSYVNIPAHTKHRVEWTDPDQPTVWLAVHYR
jgi:cupin 2 domain-containing protein